MVWKNSRSVGWRPIEARQAMRSVFCRTVAYVEQRPPEARGLSIHQEVPYDNHFRLVFGAASDRIEADDPRRRRVDRHLSRIRSGQKNLPAEEGSQSRGPLSQLITRVSEGTLADPAPRCNLA